MGTVASAPGTPRSASLARVTARALLAPVAVAPVAALVVFTLAPVASVTLAAAVSPLYYCKAGAVSSVGAALVPVSSVLAPVAAVAVAAVARVAVLLTFVSPFQL